MIRIGCHLSVAKGFVKAVDNAPKLGATCFQYFTKNPRGFRGAKPLNVVDAEEGRTRMQELNLVTVGHTPYLINLATPDEELFQLSVDALVQDLVIGEARGSYGVIVHCGKPKDKGLDWGITRMQEALARVLERNKTEHVMILLENTAGQGSEIGTTIEQLLAIADPFPKDKVGFCLDTQHAFAAGILSSENIGDFEGFRHPEFMDGLKAIHLNDSKVPFGAKKDRHELIGQGFMGINMIQAILNEPRLHSIPFFLETPVESEAQYADEIRTCRELLGSDKQWAT
ncbi:Endonuclease IV [Sulfobacillus thermosulfidooxidans DSM 9293]|uniref:Probable endonuclease 4 n=1 Tax=Sulfobacillus thermosulfidooxidans (strain DSM 9293 / VKM B-1269 / AT-1) TaxID=929705 RepID=A0A1W1WE01_SULTA|nr:deoxyribonuclease IV [Sulfobacillus thermosulfidooxidans]SMC04432.1 Endonuclease IV [Sulfobacillus thermosulfidooxidans DSM 9293]